MLRPATLLLALFATLAVPARADDGATLRGSPSSMVRQNQVAKQNDFSFLRTGSQVREFVEKGHLVRLEGDANYRVNDGVSYPYARPEMRTFVERLGAQYREGCGEKLVVTSLTRPLANQPGNAHALSVHPTGMAVDFRISQNPRCRAWLEGTLLSLERKGLLDVTRERTPPHYHVAVFPDRYGAHVEKLREDSIAAAKAAERSAKAAPAPSPAPAAPAPAAVA
ncbi:MAG TPA: DUF5715 family protein, partial [Longimicrobiaceae bacterium]|nr:DUF5715 family protein [Longimicrobiaceae bacterium]